MSHMHTPIITLNLYKTKNHFSKTIERTHTAIALCSSINLQHLNTLNVANKLICTKLILSVDSLKCRKFS